MKYVLWSRRKKERFVSLYTLLCATHDRLLNSDLQLYEDMHCHLTLIPPPQLPKINPRLPHPPSQLLILTPRGSRSHLRKLIQAMYRRSRKHDLLAWIRSKTNILQPHDRLLIVLVSHGQGGSGNLMLVTCGRYEFLTKSEVIAALNVLPINTRITIMNEAAICSPSLGCGRSQFTRMANCLNMCLASGRN